MGKVYALDHIKNGKHGKAKTRISLKDIFTEKKFEVMEQSQKTVKTHALQKTEFYISNIEEDEKTGEMVASLYDESNDEWLSYPLGKDASNDVKKLEEQMVEMFDNDEESICVILQALNKSKLLQIKKNVPRSRY